MRTFLPLALLAAVAGCNNSVDSLVVVDVTADAPLVGVAALAVTASASASAKNASFRVTPPGGASTFDVDGAGQTFGIDLPKGVTGPLHVHVDALDATDAIMASGDGDTTIKAGARVDLPLTLTVLGATDGGMGDDGGGDMGPSTGGAALAIDRTMQSFGNVTVSQSSASVAIAVTNHGNQPTSAITFTPSGANLDQFGLNSDCGAVLMPNQSCHVNATFKPTAAGDKHARFVVAAAMGGMVAADLSGTGTPPGTLTITADQPANGDCGAALVGAASGTVATYTVKNVGATATGMPSVSTSDAMQFAASGCSVASLQPNDTCTVSVQFTAKHRGQQTASVSVSAAPGGTANASASGTGQAPASFNITSTSGFDFGSAAVGANGGMLTLTATNSGDVTSAALIASNLTGANPSSFTILSDACNTASVAAGASCDVVVRFTPQAQNALSATLNVRSSSATLGSATLTGTGTAPGTLSITADMPQNGDCGSTLIGTTSATKPTYTVKNIGTSATGAPMVTTSDTMQFAASGCAAALQPGATCTVTVTFTAKQHGAQTASVSVSATPGGTASASATGFGQNPATFGITSTSGFDFGSAATGTNGATLTFTAKNNGDVSSPALAATSLTGTNPTSFTVTSDGCSGATVAAGGTCSINVRFQPQAEGPLSATLNVRTSSATLGSASISGTGTAPGTLSISADPPANGDCGSSVIGTISSTVATYTVKNIGTSATGMPTISTSDMAQFIPSGCAVSSLAPNATCSVSVQFKPKNRGTQMATVSATAAPGGTANAPVSGVGLKAATFSFTSASGFDFGSVPRNGNSAPLTVTATNQGDVSAPMLGASSFSGGGGSFSITSDGCSGQIVAAGGNCMITAQMTPKTSGPLSATLNVQTSTAVLGSQTMTGTGTPIWVKETPSFAVGAFNAVFGSPDGSRVYAVGAAGLAILRDAAGNWSNQTVGGTTQPTFLQGWSPSGSDFWAATDYGAMRSNGSVWNFEHSSGYAVPGSGLWGFSSSDVWMSAEVDTGTVTSPMNSTTVYHFNGSSWTPETPAQQGGFLWLWGTSGSDLYAFGADLENNGSGGVRYPIISHRDATGTWTRQPNGPGLALNAGNNVGVTSMWGFGAPATNVYATLRNSGIYHSAGDGTWTAVPNTPDGTHGVKNGCYAVWGASASALWFACKSTIYSFDGNSTWATSFSDATVSSLVGLWGTSANNVYAVGNDTNNNGVIYHLY